MKVEDVAQDHHFDNLEDAIAHLRSTDHHFEDRAGVDNSTWDGGAAMSGCASSKTPASCYGAICAGKKAGDTAKQSSWALPHHKAPGSPPSAAGVRNALARLDQTDGLINKAAAQAHLEAHMKSISPAAEKSKRMMPVIYRMVRGGEDFQAIAVRDADPAKGEKAPVLFGHFAVFNRWTHIDDIFEGEFMESIKPGAFERTIKNNRDQMRILLNHGRDPQLGNKPLAPITELREDNIGAYYEGALFNGVPELVIDGIKAKQYGASFRFMVIREEINAEPKKSDYNPDAIPERTITEAKVMEFGPVTFPQYPEASASLRGISSADILREIVVNRLFDEIASDPEQVKRLLARFQPTATALDPDGPGESHSDGTTRDEPNQETLPALVVIRNPNKVRQ